MNYSYLTHKSYYPPYLTIQQIIFFHLNSGDKIVNNTDLFPVVKDLTQSWEAPVNFYFCWNFVAYLPIYTRVSMQWIQAPITLKVSDHMVDVNSLSQWGQVGNWKSTKSKVHGWWAWERRRGREPPQSSPSWGWECSHKVVRCSEL